MPDKDGGAKRKSVRDLLSVRPRRGRVNLAAMDPSETNGVERHVAHFVTNSETFTRKVSA